MVVFGKERGFLMTVGVIDKISELCPDGEIANLYDLFSDDVKTADKLKSAAALIVYMNEGFEENKAFNEPGYEAEPLTIQQVRALPFDVVNDLEAEALKATVPEQKVETESGKKK